MATFNNSAAYSILSTQKGTYYVQGGHYFSPTTFIDLGTTTPTDYQSLSSERSDSVRISGGLLDGVTIGPNSTSSAGSSGATITNPTLTGGTIDNTPIGQSAPAAGAFTTLNATSASILGAFAAEGVNSTGNGQAASITNTGMALSQTFAAETYFDSTRSANNKTADFLWNAGSFSARFKNDAGSSTVTWLSASGGQAAGITGITSNSGSGSWAHTGAFSVTGTFTPSTTNGIVGTTLANEANAGSIGEVITNTGTNVSLTTAVSANVTSVVLTAGDWDVYGSIAFNGTASTSTSRVVGGLSTVSATLPAQPYYYQHQYGVGGFTSATLPNGSVPMQRINVSTTTTVYLVAQATFTASTETATGVIIARRAR
jgi:hypothetical protein